MAKFIGQRTEKKDKNGNSLYEFDRVKVNGKTGTILNVCDMWHPEFKILLDRCYWGFRPQYVDLIEDCERLKSTDPDYITHKSVQDFMNYCKTYDYHANYVRKAN